MIVINIIIAIIITETFITIIIISSSIIILTSSIININLNEGVMIFRKGFLFRGTKVTNPKNQKEAFRTVFQKAFKKRLVEY